MRSSRIQQAFQPLRSPSLHRLKTVFSSSTSPTRSSSSSTSPLSASSSAISDLSGTSRFSFRTVLFLRRNPSMVQMEMEEERRSFGDELQLLEPRPNVPAVTGGIFEVLDGRA
ncbi:hypothetical protein BJ546DRAFT_90812 [Cryomyces antarcticus]